MARATQNQEIANQETCSELKVLIKESFLKKPLSPRSWQLIQTLRSSQNLRLRLQFASRLYIVSANDAIRLPDWTQAPGVLKRAVRQSVWLSNRIRRDAHGDPKTLRILKRSRKLWTWARNFKCSSQLHHLRFSQSKVWNSSSRAFYAFSSGNSFGSREQKVGRDSYEIS